MKKDAKITSKQAEFCNQYLVDFNGKMAAIRAGYSAKTADKQAWQLLEKTLVQKKIAELQAKNRELANITQKEILSELAAILRANIKDYLTFDGRKIVFKSFDQLTETQLKAIEGIRQTRHGIELRLHGKNWTIDRICKILGFDAAQDFNVQIQNMDESVLDAIIEKITKKQSHEHEK